MDHKSVDSWLVADLIAEVDTKIAGRVSSLLHLCMDDVIRGVGIAWHIDQKGPYQIQCLVGWIADVCACFLAVDYCSIIINPLSSSRIALLSWSGRGVEQRAEWYP